MTQELVLAGLLTGLIGLIWVMRLAAGKASMHQGKLMSRNPPATAMTFSMERVHSSTRRLPHE